MPILKVMRLKDLQPSKFAKFYTRLYDWGGGGGGQIFALTSQTSTGKFGDLAEQYLQPP